MCLFTRLRDLLRSSAVTRCLLYDEKTFNHKGH